MVLGLGFRFEVYYLWFRILYLAYRFLCFMFRVWGIMVKGMMFCVLGIRI